MPNAQKYENNISSNDLCVACEVDGLIFTHFLA